MAPDSMRSFAGIPLDRPRVMGIINVTPDSFSDGGEAFAAPAAIARGRAMAEAGAEILDVGGESTRPGAEPVPVDVELDRVLPVVRALAEDGLCVSIDTRHAEVMKAAMEAGARIINDVTALTGDKASLSLAAASSAWVVLMHMRGDPRTMQDEPHYDDAPREVRDYLAERVAACEEAGIPCDRLAVDPGIGFGKTVEHNVAILNRLEELRAIGCPVVLGLSRKSMIARLSRDEPPSDRLAGSVAGALAGLARGADIVRVHDVAETRQALAVWEAVQSAA